MFKRLNGVIVYPEGFEQNARRSEAASFEKGAFGAETELDPVSCLINLSDQLEMMPLSACSLSFIKLQFNTACYATMSWPSSAWRLAPKLLARALPCEGMGPQSARSPTQGPAAKVVWTGRQPLLTFELYSKLVELIQTALNSIDFSLVQI